MPSLNHISRCGYILIVCFCITACGSPSASSASPTAPLPGTEQAISSSQSADQSISLPTPTVSLQTPVPRTSLSITLANTAWTIDQPQGIRPIIAAGTNGILWVQFPPMETNANIEQFAMAPLPRGDYTILYTPLRAGGGALADQAKLIARLPSTIGPNDVSVTSAQAVGASHFLLFSYELLHNAQNGGTTRIRWMAPDTNTIKELVAAPEGGGAFLTTASNQDWFFWSKYHLGETGAYASDAQAGLVNMQTGQNEAITLDGSNVAIRAEWASNGTLRYTSGDSQKLMLFDPLTKQSRPQ